jgi:hypothetical protein
MRNKKGVEPLLHDPEFERTTSANLKSAKITQIQRPREDDRSSTTTSTTKAYTWRFWQKDQQEAGYLMVFNQLIQCVSKSIIQC